MTARLAALTIGTLLALGLAGCASGTATRQARATSPSSSASPSGSASPSSSLGSGGDLNAQFAQNRERATDQARRLLSYAVIPPGAKELADQPAGLAGPALGMPADQTYADLVKYYRLRLPIADAAAFVRSHPPAGFTEEGSAQGGSNHTVGYAWYGSNSDSTVGQLSMVLAPADSNSSYLRVDGGEYFADPRPVKDSQPGSRLRIEAGGPCPDRDRGVVGVRNPGLDLDRQLAPAATATGGLVCSYSGFNGNRQALLSSRTLTASEAGRLGSLAHQVDLSHSDGLRSCPNDDGSTQALVLDYPDRPAVDLWLRLRGCTSVSNGQVMAGGNASVAALLDAVR